MKLWRRHKLVDIEGMAQVGLVDDKYEVYVNTDDGGNIPHFHYRLKNNWKKFHTCIRITSAEYFHHTGKESILNSKQLKDLIQFLNSSISLDQYNDKFNDNYELIVFMWNINNSAMLVDSNTRMPDYSKLNS